MYSKNKRAHNRFFTAQELHKINISQDSGTGSTGHLMTNTKWSHSTCKQEG